MPDSLFLAPALFMDDRIGEALAASVFLGMYGAFLMCSDLHME